jgi:molecular chaperone DnaK
MGAPAAMLLADEWENPAPGSQDLVACHMGAGATGIAVANVGDRVCAVEAYRGDAWLGGDDFDRCIVQWLVREFQKREKIDLLGDPHALNRLREAAESAKIELSSRQQAEIYLPHLAAGPDFPGDLSRALTRPQFEELARDLLETFREHCRQVLQDRWDRTAIDGVILGGSATRMPMIQDAASTVFGSTPLRRADPAEIVALGAAVQAAILQGQEKDILLLDATALTLSIETLGGVATPLIPCNTNIPARIAQVFSTAADNQSQVEINVVQGQGEKAADNRSLGKFILDGIPPAPKGVPQIEVTFEIDADSILHVSAREKTTGKEMVVRI